VTTERLEVILRRPVSPRAMSDTLLICDWFDRAQAQAPFLSAYCEDPGNAFLL